VLYAVVYPIGDGIPIMLEEPERSAWQPTLVMPGLVPGIHVLERRRRKT
jgi:hypothetical protein